MRTQLSPANKKPFPKMNQPPITSQAAGYFSGGLPYNRLGHGPRPLVIFQGLMFENKPQPRLVTRMYSFLGRDYTVYCVLRRPGMPQGYTFGDMAGDYAAMIREEFGSPVDVLGLSTGGSLVQQFAADYPNLVRRLVIHSSAYTLSEPARALQLEVGRLAAERRWRAAWETLLRFTLQPEWLAGPLAPFAALILSGHTRGSIRPAHHHRRRGSVQLPGEAG